MSKLAEALRVRNTRDRAVILEPLYTAIEEDYQKITSPYEGLFTTYSISAEVFYSAHISEELLQSDPKALQAVTDVAKKKIIDAFFGEFREPINNISKVLLSTFGYSDKTLKVLNAINDLQHQMFDYDLASKQQQ